MSCLLAVSYRPPSWSRWLYSASSFICHLLDLLDLHHWSGGCLPYHTLTRTHPDPRCNDLTHVPHSPSPSHPPYRSTSKGPLTVYVHTVIRSYRLISFWSHLGPAFQVLVYVLFPRENWLLVIVDRYGVQFTTVSMKIARCTSCLHAHTHIHRQIYIHIDFIEHYVHAQDIHCIYADGCLYMYVLYVWELYSMWTT